MKLIKLECDGCGSNDFIDLDNDLIKCKHCGSIYRLNYSDADVELMKYRDLQDRQRAINRDFQIRDGALQLYNWMPSNRWFSFEKLQRKYSATREEVNYLVGCHYLEADDRVPGYKHTMMYRK